MKRAYVIPILAVVCLLFATLACGSGGSSEPIIETPAKNLNLTAAELGFDWTQQGEQGMGQIAGISEEDVQDANMRMFGSEQLTGMVMSIVFTTESVAAAKGEMKGQAIVDLGSDLETQLPGLTLEALDPPDVGDEAVAVGGNYADLAMNVYMLAFRKANVIVIFSLMGAQDTVNEDLLADYAQKVEAKIQ